MNDRTQRARAGQQAVAFACLLLWQSPLAHFYVRESHNKHIAAFLEMVAIRIAIIGSAGRNTDAAKMSLDLFESVVRHAKCEIDRIAAERSISIADVCLVSGGSAWIDHVAVRLYIESCLRSETVLGGLYLYLPCNMTDHIDPTTLQQRVQFDASHTGKRLQQLHQSFTNKVKERFDPLQDLLNIQSFGAFIDTSQKGFHARNNLVADVDIILAYTWGDSLDMPTNGTKGGTADTWNKSRATSKLHFPLSMFQSDGSNNEPTTTSTSTTTISSTTLTTARIMQPNAKRRRRKKGFHRIKQDSCPTNTL